MMNMKYLYDDLFPNNKKDFIFYKLHINAFLNYYFYVFLELTQYLRVL